MQKATLSILVERTQNIFSKMKMTPPFLMECPLENYGGGTKANLMILSKILRVCTVLQRAMQCI